MATSTVKLKAKRAAWLAIWATVRRTWSGHGLAGRDRQPWFSGRTMPHSQFRKDFIMSRVGPRAGVADSNLFGGNSRATAPAANAGGLLLALLLLHSGLTRRWISLLGLVGYPVLLLGVLADMLGVVDLGSNAGAVFFVPGGLFEIVLPLQLFAFGFHRAPGLDTGRSAG